MVVKAINQVLCKKDDYNAIADEILRLRDMRKQAEVDRSEIYASGILLKLFEGRPLQKSRIHIDMKDRSVHRSALIRLFFILQPE